MVIVQTSYILEILEHYIFLKYLSIIYFHNKGWGVDTGLGHSECIPVQLDLIFKLMVMF